MTHALSTLATTTVDAVHTWIDVALAALNVAQTIALAYLAASRHVERRQ